MTNEEMLQNKDVYREQIIKNNIRLVYKLAQSFVKYRSWDREFLDDLIGEGYIGLCKAVDFYDTSKNIKFSTFASACIINSFFSYIRNTNDIKYENHYRGKLLSLSENLDESKLTKRQRDSLRRYRRVSGGQVDLITDENEFENIGMEQEEGYDADLFKKLSEEEEGLDKYILNNFHKSNREMANTFEVSPQTIANHRKRILKDLREKL